jgi:hypothetical protein
VTPSWGQVRGDARKRLRSTHAAAFFEPSALSDQHSAKAKWTTTFGALVFDQALARSPRFVERSDIPKRSWPFKKLALDAAI